MAVGQSPQRSYPRRLLIGTVSAWLMISATSLSLQPQSVLALSRLGVILGVILGFSLCGASLCALVIRRSDLALVLGSQLTTVAAIFLWFALQR